MSTGHAIDSEPISKWQEQIASDKDFVENEKRFKGCFCPTRNAAHTFRPCRQCGGIIQAQGHPYEKQMIEGGYIWGKKRALGYGAWMGYDWGWCHVDEINEQDTWGWQRA